MTRIFLETRIDAPPERCFELSLTVEVHLTTPGAKETAVDGVRSGQMRLNDFVTWETRRLLIRQRMTSKISKVEGQRLFVDEMQSGPFRSWRHVHRFIPEGEETRMTDEVEYFLPLGVLGLIVDRAFLRRYMTNLLRAHNDHIRVLAEGRDEE